MGIWDAPPSNPLADLEAAARMIDEAPAHSLSAFGRMLETIEASCRYRMATITESRGFDSQRERNDDLAAIDALLDRYNELTQA